MTDIVERLKWFHEHGMCSDFKLIYDAWIEIERLRSAVQEGAWTVVGRINLLADDVQKLRVERDRLRAEVKYWRDGEQMATGNETTPTS